MIRRILVPIQQMDAIGLHIFQEALGLAKATGASLKLLHVLSVDDETSPGIFNLISTPDHKKRWDEFEKPGLEMLRTLTDQAIAAGVSAESVQTLGRPTHVVCETARAWDADLIMLGRRGISELSEMLLGSVSSYVAHHAPCSVMVVQGTATRNEARSSLRETAEQPTQAVTIH